MNTIEYLKSQLDETRAELSKVPEGAPRLTLEMQKNALELAVNSAEMAASEQRAKDAQIAYAFAAQYDTTRKNGGGARSAGAREVAEAIRNQFTANAVRAHFNNQKAED